jgi:hypothetical protein
MGASGMLRRIAFGIGLLAPALAAAQAPATPAPEIENYSGMFFYCKPITREDWTRPACEEIGKTMAALAARAKKPVVLLKAADTRDRYPHLAQAQGFDSARAIWFLLTIDPHPRNKGQWEIAARADGINKTPAPNGQPQTVTYSKRADVVSASAVAEKSGELLGSIMFVLTTPMRPL